MNCAEMCIGQCSGATLESVFVQEKKAVRRFT